MAYPETFRFTKDHEWVEKLEGPCRVGLTNFAQGELGDIVFVELPEVGKELKKGEAFGVVESVKAVSDCYMPVSGKIAQINETLTDNPALVNESPHDEGWMIKLEPSAPGDYDELMDPTSYEQYLKENG